MSPIHREPSNEEIWEGRADRAATSFTRNPWRWGCAAVIVVVLAVLTFGIGHFACGWANKAAEVAGPANVSAQFKAVIGDWNGMQTAAANACAAKDAASSGNSPTLLEDPAFAYQATYRHITVDYNTRQNDIFEAGVVGPGGYPKVAPTLEEMEAQVC